MPIAYPPGSLCASKKDRFVDLGTMGPSCNQAPINAGQFTGDVPVFKNDDIDFSSLDTCAPDTQAPTPEGGYRPMTIGEILMVECIFGTSIKYHEVKIYKRKFIFFQPDDTTMAPDGNIWFNPGFFEEDFSAQPSLSKKAHFIHEMTHVWQKHLGYPVMLRGAIRIGLDYQYKLSEAKKLSNYNMEAQGEIISDYFMLKHLNQPQSVSVKEYRDVKYIPLYEKVLSEFLADPANKKNTP